MLYSGENKHHMTFTQLKHANPKLIYFSTVFSVSAIYLVPYGSLHSPGIVFVFCVSSYIIPARLH